MDQEVFKKKQKEKKRKKKEKKGKKMDVHPVKWIICGYSSVI